MEGKMVSITWVVTLLRGQKAKPVEKCWFIFLKKEFS